MLRYIMKAQCQWANDFCLIVPIAMLFKMIINVVGLLRLIIHSFYIFWYYNHYDSSVNYSFSYISPRVCISHIFADIIKVMMLTFSLLDRKTICLAYTSPIWSYHLILFNNWWMSRVTYCKLLKETAQNLMLPKLMSQYC